jgi:pyruvate dehydrogenase E2 component (dihydrolipoamide acetyltransferase)
MAIEVKLPEMGEGIASGDVVRVLVKPGDTVSEGQGLLELETDKALIEVPSSAAGTVEKILVKQGDKVKVGAAIATINATAGAAGAVPATQAPPSQAESAAGGSAKAASQPTATADAGAVDAAWASAAPPPSRTNGANGRSPNGAGAAPAPPVQAGLKPRAALLAAPGSRAESQANLPAGPATRRIARELGIDLATVPGSGPGGRIYQSDVVDFYKQQGTPSIGGGTAPAMRLPDFTKWGNVRREPLSKVRAKTAEQMALCWATVARVTQFERADITALEAFRQRKEAAFEKRGGKLTFTVLAIRAVVSALRAYPKFNSSLDLAAGELVYKDYIHLGIAVDTERGLLVPVLRDADKKDLVEIASGLTELAEHARTGKIDLADLQGASFTISNQGSIGGAEFTPIVNWPEVAILGIGRARQEPGINPETDAVEARLHCPLALSYDHRVVDGADAARFIRLLKELLEDPERLLLGV